MLYKKRTLVWITIGFVGVLMMPLLAPHRNSPSTPQIFVGSGFTVLPESLARLVEHSSLIVVASYQDIVALGTEVLVTPDPTPTLGGVAAFTPPPLQVAGVVGTNLVVSSVIKSNGNVSPSQSIAYRVYGAIPASPTEIAIDLSAGFPHIWPVDTDFLVFLDGESPYYLPYGACGRILLENDISCSDGDRTVLPFMTGLSAQEFIDAVEDEVEHPSSTVTPYPFPTITP